MHFKQALAPLRPELQVVGDELHPLFQGRDFGPYVRQLLASGAQALVTANWGADLRDLVHSLVQERSAVTLYAYGPSLHGVPTALAKASNRSLPWCGFLTLRASAHLRAATCNALDG